MSSAPPNMPPGGGTPPPPYPPYDPKTQWRVYREQQRAAWRAQRDAWKAQRYAMKAGYVGTYGPRVPSIVGPIILIGIGIIAMLVMTGHIAASQFWAWYGRWWPLLLIGAGLALLAEWAVDLRRETPIRRGGGFIGILVILAIVGFAATGVNKLGAHFDGWNDNNNFFGSFSGPEHDNDQQVLSAQIPPNSTIEIQDPIGNVSVMGGDGSTIEVQAHEVAYAESDAEAKKIFNAEAAQLKSQWQLGAGKVRQQFEWEAAPDHHCAENRKNNGECGQGRRDRGRTGRRHQCDCAAWRRSLEQHCRLRRGTSLQGRVLSSRDPRRRERRWSMQRYHNLGYIGQGGTELRFL